MFSQGSSTFQGATQTVETPNKPEVIPTSIQDTPLTLDQTSTLACEPENVMSQAPAEVDSVTSSNTHAVFIDSRPAITTAEDVKLLLKERLPKEQSGSAYQGHIRSVADFKAQSRLYESLSYKAPGSAVDFPQDDAGLVALARGLAEAMTNMTDAVEVGKKSVARINQLSPYEIELKSWQLIFVLRDVQLGRVDLHLWGAEWNIETYETFMDRYEDVKSNLRASKSLVSSLFDQEFSVRLALAPGGELKKKMANSKNNSRRAIDLAEIRNQKKRSLESSQDNSVDDQEENPRKRLHTEAANTSSTTDTTSNAIADAQPEASESSIYGYLQPEDFHVNLDEEHDYAN